MNPRDLSAELSRLHALAKSLVGAIEALHAKIQAPVPATIPPPARPTTRVRRPPPTKPSMSELPSTQSERNPVPPTERPPTEPAPAINRGAGGYRIVKKRP